MATGGFFTLNDSPEDVQLSRAELEAIIHTARDLHVPVTAHAYTPGLITTLAELGISGIEHASLIDESACRLLEEKGISATVVDMYCVKPLDQDAIIRAAQNARAVITVEEHSPFGGLGSMVAQVVAANCPKKVVNMTLPDEPVITGTSKEVFDYYGLNAEGIAKKAEELLG